MEIDTLFEIISRTVISVEFQLQTSERVFTVKISLRKRTIKLA